MRILVPVDFYKTSFSAFRYAVQVAEDFGGEVTALHVMTASFDLEVPVTNDFILDMEKSLQKKLTYFVGDYATEKGFAIPSEVAVKTELVQGIPGMTISNYTEENDYDLVIMGTRDRHNVFDRIFGSVSRSVIQACECPVMLIHTDTFYSKPDKIAFALDSDTNLKNPMAHFLPLQKEFQSNVTFVHLNLTPEDSIEKEKQFIASCMSDHYTFDQEQVVDEVIPQLQEYCTSTGMEMLVMVKKEENFAQRLLKGSDSIKMAQEFQLPVLVLNE